MIKSRWSDDEILFLVKNHQIMSLSKIANHHILTESGVYYYQFENLLPLFD